jgi:hypothetical protein
MDVGRALSHSSTEPLQGILTACVAKPGGAVSREGRPEGKPPAYCALTACMATSSLGASVHNKMCGIGLICRPRSHYAD